jgi:hypothetical protein
MGTMFQPEVMLTDKVVHRQLLRNPIECDNGPGLNLSQLVF